MVALVDGLSRGARRDITNRSPVPLVQRAKANPLFGQRGTAGLLTYLDVYGQDGVVHPIVSRLAESVAEAQWHLFAKSSTGDPLDRTEITSDAILDLWEKPNSFQPMSEIMENGQQHYELAGETSIVLGFTPGVRYPLDMWLLRPDRIDPIPDAYDFLKGWIYTAPGDQEKIPLEPRELLRVRHPHPTDPYRGMGAVQSLMRDLDAQRFTKEWQASFFANSARPGGMLKVDRQLTDEDFDLLSRRWAETHQGISKAHRVAILEQAEWVENSFSLKDLQIAELDSVGRDKALVAFGFPKSMLGIVEDVNRANAEAGEYVYARWLVKPRLARWRSMFNRQLVPLFDPSRRKELDFDDPVPENSESALAELKTKTDVLVALVAEGFDSAQVLEMLDWPALEREKPEPEVVKVPSRLGGAPPAIEPDDDPAARAREMILAFAPGSVDNAMRWKVMGKPDENCCDPCRKNLDKLYRSRAAAYADYPGGRGYIKCVGAQYGNRCRCKVVKRRNGR